MTRPRRLLAPIAALAACLILAAVDWFVRPGSAGARAAEPVFAVAPYLQPGDAPAADAATAVLMWQTADPDPAAGRWAVEVRSGDSSGWRAAGPVASRRVAPGGVAPFVLHRAGLSGLAPGSEYDYRVLRGGSAVFQARARTRPAPGRPQRFVVFGDCAAGTEAQRAVAFRTSVERPDYVVITGDVVYTRGRVSEYLDHYFPVYNADRASRREGAPLLRSTPVFAAPGNHDLVERDLDKYPDGLAFFYYWDLPRNGPLAAPGAAGSPVLGGAAAKQKAFLEAAGTAYPRTAVYSFDAGDVHWTVVDSNPYADWTDPTLRGWLDADLASPAARRAAWRFVALHHPPFNSSKAHADDQRSRLLAPAFERGKVDVVFGGHVHNYQRTHPLKFAPAPPPADNGGKPYGPGGKVAGTWALDREFDGRAKTRPDGVIYVITGAGGAKLYDPAQTSDPKSWQPYTARFVSDTHSLTVVDATAGTLTVRQVAADGREIDRWVVTR